MVTIKQMVIGTGMFLFFFGVVYGIVYVPSTTATYVLILLIAVVTIWRGQELQNE